MNPSFAQRLFREMLRIRVIEEEIARLYPEQQMRCPVHLCIGQEAIAVGVSASLGDGDYVLGGHRSHGHYLAKGGDLKAMMAELYGKATGCSKGKGGSMHLVDLSVGFVGSSPIVASTLPIAVGTALGSVMKKEKRISVVFFGEGATEEGVFHESVNFAVLKRLPVVFVCENNLYSVYSPMTVRQPEQREIADLVSGHALESFQADGNDVQKVFSLADYAVAKARDGGGPTFLEFKTYRWLEHVGPYYDNDLGYRTEEETEMWKERCPVKKFKESLIEDGTLTEDAVAVITKELRNEMETAIVYAKTSPFPEKDMLSKHIYAG